MSWKPMLAAVALCTMLPLAAYANQCPCPPPGFIVVCPQDEPAPVKPPRKKQHKQNKPAPAPTQTANVTNNITNNTYNWNVAPPAVAPTPAPAPAVTPPATPAPAADLPPDDGIISYYRPPRILDAKLALDCPNLSPELRSQILDRKTYRNLYTFDTLVDLGEDQLNHDGTWSKHSCGLLQNPYHP